MAPNSYVFQRHIARDYEQWTKNLKYHAVEFLSFAKIHDSEYLSLKL